MKSKEQIQEIIKTRNITQMLEALIAIELAALLIGLYIYNQ